MRPLQNCRSECLASVVRQFHYDILQRPLFFPFYHSDLVKAIIGIRRCGKSVLLRQIEEELLEMDISPSHILFLNFEDLEYSRLTDAMALHAYVRDLIQDNQKYYLLFDEIQNVRDFEKAVNSFRAAMNVSIFITGSNSRLLSGELSTLLSGRYVSFRIFPFRFREVCQLKGLSRNTLTDQHILEYMKWGGMPQRFQFQTESETRVYLTDLFNSIILRDIIQRSRTKDIESLSRLILKAWIENYQQKHCITTSTA